MLKVAIVGYNQIGALFVSIKKVTSLASCYRIYEHLYSPEVILGLYNLYIALIDLYAAVL
jgi:hypothetical protein